MTILDDTEKDAIQEALTKKDLLDIVIELNMEEVEMATRYSQVVDLIVKDFDDNGVPEWGDCSKLLRKFLMTAKITDATGELIDKEAVEETDKEVASDSEIDYPDCYGFADLKDPACNRCKVVESCLVKHEQIKPPCYGKEYSSTAPECAICLECVKCEELSK
jgi:hypothetical protein